MEKSTLVATFFIAKIIAFLFFMFDVAFDLKEHIANNVPYESGELVHLSFEVFAVFALGAGIFVTTQYMALLRERKQNAELSLHHLRKDFGGLIEEKFQRWNLTPAEKDISVLLLKGFGTSEISELRSTKLGTVKLQVHKVLQKAGATNRAEFMSMFMDDFLDLGSESM